MNVAEPILLFVYGTLRRYDCRHGVLNGQRFVAKGTTPGALYSLGYYPAFVKGTNQVVHGEVYAIDTRTLRQCDSIEGYSEGRVATSCLYVRKLVTVQLDDGHTVKAFVYEYANKRYLKPSMLIKSGDWFVHTGRDPDSGPARDLPERHRWLV